MSGHENSDDTSGKVERLLEIEQICDQFEDRVARGQPLDITAAVRQVSRELRSQVREHLNRIAADARSSERSADRSSDMLSLREGTVIDRYRLVRHLGSGGTATVWCAQDVDSETVVAIKISIRPDDDASQRFQREAETTSRLEHDQVVTVRDTGVYQGQSYLVTDFVEGESLATRLKNRPPTPREAARMISDVTEIIAHAHQQGVVHRDLKPHNVLIDGSGRAHLTDFGLAKELSGELDALTKTGEILGTPAYMAPEQAGGHGGRADERTDIYSLGVMFFRMLTGDVPFRGTPQSVIYQILHVEASSPRSLQPAVPADLDTICMRCIEKLPGDRFQSATELHAELDRFLRRQPIHCKSPSAPARMRKWAARNRRLAASLLASVALLLTISVISTAAAVSRKNALHRERQIRAVAEDAQRKAMRYAAQARREADLSRRTQEFLTSIIEASDPVDEILVNNSVPSDEPASTVTILGRAERRIREELKDQPLTQARLMDTLGNACRAAAMFEQAQGLLEDAEKLRRDVDRPGADLQRDRLRNDLHQARLMHDLGRHDCAWRRYEELIARLRGTGPRGELELATALFFFGKLQTECRKNDLATASFRESLSIRRRRLAPGSVAIKATEIALSLSGDSWREQLVGLLSANDWAAGIALKYMEMLFKRETKQFDGACRLYEDVIEQLAARMGDRSLLVLMAKGDYAGLLYDAGRLEECEHLIRSVLDQVPAVARSHPQARQAQLRLALELMHAGRIDEAGEIYQRLGDFYQEPAEYPEELLLGLIWSQLASGMTARPMQLTSVLLERTGRMAEQSAWYQYTRARVHRQRGESKEAEQWDGKALRSAASINYKLTTATALARMALIFQHNGDLRRAEGLMREAIRTETYKRFAGHPRVARYKAGLAAVLEERGMHDESLRLHHEAMAIWNRSLPKTDGRILQTEVAIERLEREIARRRELAL